MPLVKNFPDGETYEPAPGERMLDLQTTADVPLHVGIRKGEYMIAQPAAEPQVTYVLTQEQYVRLQQQIKMQVTYQNWIKSGVLTITEVLPAPPEPPPPEPEPDPDHVLDNALPGPQPDIDNTLPPEPDPEGRARDDDRPTWR